MNVSIWIITIIELPKKENMPISGKKVFSGVALLQSETENIGNSIWSLKKVIGTPLHGLSLGPDLGKKENGCG